MKKHILFLLSIVSLIVIVTGCTKVFKSEVDLSMTGSESVLSGEALTGELLTGDILSGAVLSGEVLTGNELSGDVFTGDLVACTMDYTPVCAKVQIQCITTPCPPIEQTFSNRCMMDANKLAEFAYTGECKTEILTGRNPVEKDGNIENGNMINDNITGILSKMKPVKNILKDLGKSVKYGSYTVKFIEGKTKDKFEITNNGKKTYVDLNYDKTCNAIGDTGPCGKFISFRYVSKNIIYAYLAYGEDVILGVLDLSGNTVKELNLPVQGIKLFDVTKAGDQFFGGNSEDYDSIFAITHKGDLTKSYDLGILKVFWYYSDTGYLYLKTSDKNDTSNIKLFLRKIDLSNGQEVYSKQLK